MTSFDSLESSQESSKPLEVYRFRVGDAAPLLYTSAPDTIVVGADTYVPEAIDRSTFGQGPEERKQTVDIRLPMLNVFASRYLNIVPGQTARVAIIQLQRDEVPTYSTQLYRFRGKVISVDFDDEDFATLHCVSHEYAGNRVIPNRTFAHQCGLLLYGTDCGASTVGHTYTGTVTAVSGNTITVSGAGASGLDFVSGWAQSAGGEDLRTVLAQSGDVMTLLIPFATSPLGSTVTLFEGCDHLIDGDCQARFGRGLEYGGFPYVPSKDIFRSGVV